MATAVALMVLDAAGFAPISGARRAAVSAGAPIGRLLAAAVAPATNLWAGAVHVDELEAENRELRRRNAELAGALAGRPDVEAELAELLTATEIPFVGNVERVTARVAADRRSDVERVVEIDKGSTVGIDRGMPVVTGNGLVGVVQLVTADRSVIRLLTDVELAVGVRSRDGLGLVEGDGGGRLRFTPSPALSQSLAESLAQGTPVEGVRFVTSGVDRSVFPAGIPVGSLAVDRPPQDRPPSPAGPRLPAESGDNLDPPDTDETVNPGSMTFWLDPFADLDRLGFVTVLLVEPAP